MKKDYYAVIMAGGFGTRFWPLSRKQRPKHFIKLIGGNTLVRHSIDNISSMFAKDKIIIIANKLHSALLRSEAYDIPKENIILEPRSKDTAPCVALSALRLQKKSPDSVFCVLPADHYIHPKKVFQKNLKLALDFAKHNDALVTFGIKPTHPSTAFGYIQVNDIKKGVVRVSKFHEKPLLSVAKRYISSGQYFWNSGIFVWKTSSILNALEQFAPNMLNTLKRSSIKSAYDRLEKVSIDYAVMEKAKNAYMIRAEFNWSDVGNWQALYDILPKDKSHNVATGNFINYKSKNCVVISENNHLIGTLGVENLVIVNTKDATLVMRIDQNQQLKELVKSLPQKYL